MTKETSEKSRTALVLFSLFLGGWGFDRFYLGQTWLGVLKLITLGGLGVWTLVDFIMAVAGLMKDKEGRLVEDW